MVINDWLIVGEPGITFTPGQGSLTGGRYSSATGYASMAMGYGAHARGNSIAMGTVAEAFGRNSTAIGVFTEAWGNSSTAMGVGTQAYGRNTTVIGVYNESVLASSSDLQYQDNADGHMFVVGNGSDDNIRSNAMVVYHDGAVDVGKNDADDTVPLKVTSDGSVILAKEQGDISMGAFGN